MDEAAQESVHAGHPPLGFVRRYVFSLDHKVIAKQYLFTGLAFLAFSGWLALVIRWQLSHPFERHPILGMLLATDAAGAVLPTEYTKLFTMHGSLMVFFAITPILIGAFGNFIIPLAIGARDMAFPFLNMLSYWVIVVASLVMVAVFLVPGGAAGGGWTTYAPLASNMEALPGHGQTLWILGIALAGTSTLLGAVNYIATVLNLRCPGMSLMRLPLTVWGLFLTAVLNLLWVPLIAAALFMLLLDRVAGTTFFVSGPLAPHDGGQPLLFQHLFWGFGHPEVYILILPVWGIVGDLLAVFSRKPAFGYKASVISMVTIVLMSQVVWGHHMYTAGMNPLLGTAFMFLTISVSVPTAILFFNWLATLWRGSIRINAAMASALSVVFMFALGGLTGLFNAVQALDIYLHETTFIVGHFHYTLSASVFLGTFAAIYYWFPKMFGRQMNDRLGVIHVALTFVGLNVVFFSMLWTGVGGNIRRIGDPSLYEHLQGFAVWQTVAWFGALGLSLAQLLFVANFVWALVRGPKATANPWESTTLEWMTASPPPHENFDSLPIVNHPPHEHSLPGMARDWVGQNESVLSDSVGASRGGDL